MTAANDPAVAAFAPAKVNLALHVTGRRADGYHLLDSLVVFADFGDRLTLRPAESATLEITGPKAGGVPADEGNLCLRAAAFFGAGARIGLEKHLPMEAGLGGGSSDAAAVLRGLSEMTGRPVPPGAEVLGADVPVCLAARAARMSGIGEVVAPVDGLPDLPALLVNPGVGVATPRVFAGLARRDNPGLPDAPRVDGPRALCAWLHRTRNDLEAPARRAAPVIDDVLSALSRQAGCLLSRMSGSGATCFGIFPDRAMAGAAGEAIAAARPDWWVRPVTLR